MVKYHVTYLGTAENFLAGERTTGASEGYNDASQKHFDELQTRLQDYPEDPVVFLIGQYYKGLCNGARSAPTRSSRSAAVGAGLDAIEVGPDTYVLQGDGLYTPPQDVVDRAEAAAVAEQTRLENHPGALANPLHTLRVLVGLFFLAFLPGLIAAPWFELRDAPSRVALIPGMSIVLTLLSGIAVLAVWRGPLTTTKAWAVVGVATAVALGFRFGAARLEPRARVVRRVLQQHVLRLLQPRVRHVGRRAVPGAGGTGRDPRRVREVDRVRRREGVRRHGRPLGAIPAEGRAGALRPVHAREPVHRRRASTASNAGGSSACRTSSRPSWSRSSRSPSCCRSARRRPRATSARPSR